MSTQSVGTFINAANKPQAITRGEKVVRGHIPKWFPSDRGSWFDHAGTCGDAVVCEPYALSNGYLREILEFADENGLRVTVTGHSWHFPNETVRVEFTRRSA